MRDKRRFDLGGAEPVAGKIFTGIGAEIGVDETLMVAIYSAHHARPGISNAKIAARRAFQKLPFGIDELRHDAEEWQCRRTRLEANGAGKRRDENAAGLGLPPRVDDRAAAVADHTMVPLPSLRIDRLADGAEQPQRSP